MDSRPIGVFDSGVGGLTAIREMQALLPHENIVYLGDTGRIPYGSRSRETILEYARQDMSFLLNHNVKLIVAACGTVSSNMSADFCENLPVPYMGVIENAVNEACARTVSGRIGVLGTKATIKNGAFERGILNCLKDARVFSKACPLFVPAVEDGHFGKDDEIARLLVRHYLEPLREEKIDTLILGCTHYPLLSEVISEFFEGNISLINPSLEVTKSAAEFLKQNKLENSVSNVGNSEFYVTDDPESFCEVADVFLGKDVRGSAKKVSVLNL